MSDGSYKTSPISTTDYSSAGISAPFVPKPSTRGGVPTGGADDVVLGGGSEFIKIAGQWAENAAQRSLLIERLRELELPASQHTMEMEKKRFAFDIGMRTFDDIMTYGKSIGYVPRNMPSARELAGMMTPTLGTTATTQTGTSLEEARQELFKASGGMDFWNTAPDDQVTSEYKKLSGRDVGVTATARTAAQPQMQSYFGNLLPTLERTSFESSKSALQSQYPALSYFPQGYTATPQAIPTLEAEISDLKSRLGSLQAAGSQFGSFRTPTYR